jgi:hypothetical protein
MRWSLVPILVLSGAVAVSAAILEEDFESTAIGALPAGWTVATPWGDWAPGPVTAEVAASPTGGQALMFVHGTDWGSYGASSGEVDTPFIAVSDPATDKISIQFDMWKENWRTWQVAGDQAWVNSFPGAAIHMNDNPAGPNEMYVGRDGPAPADVPDAPESEWISVSLYYDAATGQYSNSVSYASGSGGGTFTGTDDNEIAGQFWFGGWAFQSTMDAAPTPPGGEYDNVVYIDNFRMETIPEPATMTLLGLAGLALLRRRR